jgi:uncharacterized protein YjaZ
MRVRSTDLDDETMQVVQAIATAAEAEVRAALPDLGDDLSLDVSLGSRVIPETGEVGVSQAPGLVTWIVDPSRPEGVAGIARAVLRFTLFHELHHQVRGWVIEGGEPPASMMDAVVHEGMATAFARDAAGERDVHWAAYDEDVDDWIAELVSLPVTADYVSWMFEHPDGRRNIGYRAGTAIVDRAMAASGRSAAELVHATTAEVLTLAGVAMPPRRPQ